MLKDSFPDKRSKAVDGLAPEKPAQSKAPTSDNAIELYEVDDKGVLKGVRALARARGFDVGSVVKALPMIRPKRKPMSLLQEMVIAGFDEAAHSVLLRLRAQPTSSASAGSASGLVPSEGLAPAGSTSASDASGLVPSEGRAPAGSASASDASGLVPSEGLAPAGSASASASGDSGLVPSEGLEPAGSALASASSDSGLVPSEGLVPMDKFLRNYVAHVPTKEEEVQAGWPAKRVAATSSAALLTQKGLIFSALGTLMQSLEQRHPVVDAVQMLQKPRRMVRAARFIPAGGLVLSPDTMSLKVVSLDTLDDSDMPYNGSVRVELQPSCKENSFWLAPATAKDGLAPLWFCTATEDDRQRNMEWGTFNVQALFGCDYIGGPTLAERKRRTIGKSAKSSSSTVSDDVATTWVKIPVLVNSKPLAAGDELFVFRNKRPKREKGPEALTVTRMMKMQKITPKS